MGKIKCNRIDVIEVEFKRKLDFNEQKTDLPIRLQAEYAENKNPDKKNARLIMELQISENKDDAPFYCNLKIAGYFEWENLSSKEAQKSIEKEGTEILFSFTRTYVYNLMQKSGMDPLVLPIEHFE